MTLFLFVVLVVTLVSGLIPKALVINNPESAALRLTTIFDSVRKGMQPIISIIEFFDDSLAFLLFQTEEKPFPFKSNSDEETIIDVEEVEEASSENEDATSEQKEN